MVIVVRMVAGVVVIGFVHVIVMVRGIGAAGAVKRNARHSRRDIDDPDFAVFKWPRQGLFKYHAGGQEQRRGSHSFDIARGRGVIVGTSSFRQNRLDANRIAADSGGHEGDRRQTGVNGQLSGSGIRSVSGITAAGDSQQRKAQSDCESRPGNHLHRRAPLSVYMDTPDFIT